MDYAAARRNMIESQLRTNKVDNDAVLAAMGSVPREHFMAEVLRPLAYADENITLNPHRVVLAPMVQARMIQALAIKDSDIVLDVATGTGYGAAVLSKLAATVVGIEQVADLAGIASIKLQEIGAENAVVFKSPLAEGYAAQAPYNAIMIEGGIDREVPAVLLAQLADGGRLAAVVYTDARSTMGQVQLWQRDGETTFCTVLFEASAPRLPEFVHDEGFSF
jgi:protein-L-isoaspartate(D-aspartate) O-methyltransferase